MGMRPEGEKIRIVNANDVSIKVREAAPAARARQWRRNSREFTPLAQPGPAKEPAGPKEWTVGPRQVAVFHMHQDRPLYLVELSTLDGSAAVRCMFDNYHGDPTLMDDQGVATLQGGQGNFAFSWLVPVQPDPQVPTREHQAPLPEAPRQPVLDPSADAEPEPSLPPVVRFRPAAKVDRDRLKAAIAEYREAIREDGRPIPPNPQEVLEHPELNRANRTGVLAGRRVFPKQRLAAREALTRARMALGAPGPETIKASRDLEARKASLAAFGAVDAAWEVRRYWGETMRRMEEPYQIECETIDERVDQPSLPATSVPNLEERSNTLIADFFAGGTVDQSCMPDGFPAPES